MVAKKKTDKSSQAKGSEAEDIIEQYLNIQYRPFAINDIVQNLHNKITKTNAIKALESLVQQERITCKMFGKIAIYVCNEQDLRLPGTVTESEVTYEAATALREELAEIEKDRIALSAQLQELMKEPANENLLEIISKREGEIAALEHNITDLKANWRPENKNIIDMIKDQEKRLAKEITARRRILQNSVSLLKEATCARNMSEFLEEIGVELPI